MRRLAVILLFPLIGAGLLASEARASWGPRVGLSDDPDQFLGGVHWSGGTLSGDLQLKPNFVVGLGSNVRTFLLTLPLHWRLPSDSTLRPYVGGGFVLGIVDFEGGGDPNFEIAVDAIGGLEWRQGRGRSFGVELDLGFGDLQDIKVFATWHLP